MSARDATTSFAAALVDEWARAGLSDAVISPGSRSAPLALAVARDGRLRLHVVLDERSAAFRALGLGVAGGRPAIVLCTSGTAAANFHPAVVEASYARVPLIVCTADRPPALRDTGAGQTIDQSHLYGAAVRWFCDPGPPGDEPGSGATWRALASRAVSEAIGPPAGPVHLNLPFREPLLPTGAALVDAPGRADGRPWTVSTPAILSPSAADVARFAELVHAHPQGVLVAGWGARVAPATAERFAAAAAWPVLADPISQLRAGPLAVSAYEALLREPAWADAHRPDLVVRVGAPLTSKVANAWLDSSIAQVLVDPDDRWLDPSHAACDRYVVDAEALLDAVVESLDPRLTRAGGWLGEWMTAEDHARHAIDGVLDAPHAIVEGRVARDVAADLPDGATLVVASSVPVRALEWCMAPREGLRVLANRGANGIDGFVSTVVGVAQASLPAPTVGLCGDLCFLHDVNGLLGAPGPVTFVVLDNDGGGIFSYLPPAELPEFEHVFATPHGLDLVEVARAHGAIAERIDDMRKLHEALTPAELSASAAVRVLVVPLDRNVSVARHREMWKAVAATMPARELPPPALSAEPPTPVAPRPPVVAKGKWSRVEPHDSA
jgi:2-succinyl-5-enolpyruvyl-6-hydroxy-3-cyclohexene-1-carboxylate synthase